MAYVLVDGVLVEVPEPDSGLFLEVLLDAPCPRVGITITGLSQTAESVVTVWRSVAGEGRTAVRGMRRARVIDATYVVDYEAPLGRPVSYTLEVVGPVVPEGLEGTVTVPSVDAWLQDPLDPSTAVAVSTSSDTATGVLLTSAALREFGYADPGALVRTMGARYPVVLGGGRSPASGVPFEFVTSVIEAANRLRSLLEAASPLLVRSVPEMDPLPALAYVHGNAAEAPVPGIHGGSLTRWSLTGDLVQAPSINLLVPSWTYAQVSALYDTYASATVAGGTYLDRMKNPTPAAVEGEGFGTQPFGTSPFGGMA